MVKYSDIIDANEGRKLLDDKRAEEKAHSILNSELFRKQEEVDAMEQEAPMGDQFAGEPVPMEEPTMGQQDGQPSQEDVMQVASEAIQMMDEAEANGQDPMAILGQLPPEVQEVVAQMLDADGQDGGQQGQPMPQQGQGRGRGRGMGQGNPMRDVLTQAQQLSTPQ